MNSESHSDSSEPRVLVVDDHRDFLHCVKEALRSDGYEVLIATDGNEALASVEVFEPDLIVLDIMMPKRSGILVLEYLRTEVEAPIPVIIVTGSQGTRHREYVEYFGIADYLVKPFPIPHLVDSVNNVLRSDGEQE